MDNPDTLATSGTHDTGRRQTKPKKEKQYRKLKRLATQTLPKHVGNSRCSRRVSSSCFL